MSAPYAEHPARKDATRAGYALAVVALTLASFVVRHTGVRAYLPHEGEPHERVYAKQVELLRAGVEHPEHDTQFDYYPLFVARAALLTQPAREHAPSSVDDLRLAAGDDLAHLRTIIALLSALAVPATYLLARRFLARSWSLLAATLYAASPLAILLGQQARPHAAVVGPIVAAVLAALHVRRRPVPTSYLLAGLALGFALAILHNAIAVLPAFVVAHVLRDRKKERHVLVGVGVAVALAVAIALWAYPRGSIAVGAAPQGPDEAGDGAGAHFLFLNAFGGQGFVILARALWDYEPWLMLLATFGLSMWIARSTRTRDLLRVRGHEERLVVAAWCVPYALVIGAYDVTYERFALPLLPCVALLAAYGAASVASRIRVRPPVRDILIAGTGALVVVPEIACGLLLARAMGTTDTVMRCAQWFERDIRPGSARIAVFNTLDLPLLRTDASLHENEAQLVDLERPWLEYQGRLEPDLFESARYEVVTVPERNPKNIALFQSDLAACVAQWHADYVVLEVHTPGRRARFAALREYLQHAGERVARFSPYTDPADDQPFGYTEDRFGRFGWWTGHLLHADGFGPVVEVYRLH